MKQKNLDNDFNVGCPSKENIEYAFKNLLFYVNAAICLDIYNKQHHNFEEVLVKIKSVISQYINNSSLTVIDEKILEDIKFDLIDLDEETKNLKSYYAEWSLLWLEAIISLRMSLLCRTNSK